MCPIPNGFRDRAIWIQTAKLLIRKRYYQYVLFLIPVLIVQVTELVQFIINIRKFHRFTCFRQWRSRAGGKDNIGCPSQTTIQSNVSISEKVRNRTHVHIKFFCLEWPIHWPSRILTYPPGTFYIFLQGNFAPFGIPKVLHIFYIDVIYCITIEGCNKCHCYGIVTNYSRCIYWYHG